MPVIAEPRPQCWGPRPVVLLVLRVRYRNAPNSGAQAPSRLPQQGSHYRHTPNSCTPLTTPPPPHPSHPPLRCLNAPNSRSRTNPPPSATMGGAGGEGGVSRWWGEGMTHLSLSPLPFPVCPQRGGRSRRSRRCGACAACLRPGDCGRCDFCRDKPKFGGQNLKRQKCRWRQCLHCAAVGGPPLPVTPPVTPSHPPATPSNPQPSFPCSSLGKLRHGWRFGGLFLSPATGWGN